MWKGGGFENLRAVFMDIPGLARKFSPCGATSRDRWSTSLSPTRFRLLCPRNRARSVLQALVSRRHTCARTVVGAGVTSRVHAAALRDEHVSQDADRFASRRARRAAAVRDVKPAGTASPVPKYISSGVCPRNAECGSTVLYSWT